jgi:hypothetical protein
MFLKQVLPPLFPIRGTGGKRVVERGRQDQAGDDGEAYAIGSADAASL